MDPTIPEAVRDAVPAEIFNYIMAFVVLVVLGLVGAIAVLWRSKSNGLALELREKFIPLNERLEAEQSGRREDVERLMGEQKDIFAKGIEVHGQMAARMEGITNLLERVERLLRRQDGI